MRKLLCVVALVLLASPALAGEPVFKLSAGANAIWYDGPAGLPSDFELGGTGRASLSPHISAVGGLFFGLDNSYVRAPIGVRITASDVQNQSFSIGLGVQFQASSEPKIRPQEWAPEVSIGWKPWPEDMPNLVLGAQGFYGLDSNQATALIAARWYLGAF